VESTFDDTEGVGRRFQCGVTHVHVLFRMTKLFTLAIVRRKVIMEYNYLERSMLADISSVVARLLISLDLQYSTRG
jgi:hypothetical protein